MTTTGETRIGLDPVADRPGAASPAPRLALRGRSGAGRSGRRGMTPVGIAQGIAAGALVAGWLLRDEFIVVPDRGAGYTLGIVGLAAMVLLLGYPIRKHVRALRNAGRVGLWFQVHMVLGLVGPVAVLFHSNFALGSTNANVALACVLLVAGSGVVGRVLYVRIHEGLEGRRRTLVEVRESVRTRYEDLEANAASHEVLARLSAYESRMLGPHARSTERIACRLTAGHSGRRALRDVRRLVARSAGSTRGGAGTEQAVIEAARTYVRAVRSVVGFQIWERLFALWHIAHLPLSFLLFATAAVHVIAVHLY